MTTLKKLPRSNPTIPTNPIVRAGSLAIASNNVITILRKMSIQLNWEHFLKKVDSFTLQNLA